LDFAPAAPVRSLFCAAKSGVAAPTLMIWLPGAYHSSEDFLDAGFATAVSQRRISLDLRFVDLELQHLGDRSPLARLRSEVMLPGRASGARVWLGGISLGGLFALDCAATYPGEFDGLCLLAPYLGNRLLTGEIAAAGGLAAWEPGELAEADQERRIWRYLKTDAKSQPLCLGYGRNDRFAAAHALLAETLPADSVDIVAGGHDWRAWTTLWENFLDSRFT
jgi:pimeloyl-ACP methyl ester carboxylesterase